MYPVHLNPNVQKPVKKILSGLSNFFLLPPLSYPDFIWLLNECYFVITDSGGIQEEAPALGKPVIVTRKVTERPEAVEAGVVVLTGNDDKVIYDISDKLLNDNNFYSTMAKGVSPYGDGHAAERIISILQR